MRTEIDYNKIETEPFTQKNLNALQKALGVGAMMIDWDDIDFERGRGILEGLDRCIWNKDGRRIDICISEGGLIVSQTKK